MSSTEHLYEISGAVHLHSNYSDGSLSITEIAEIAGKKDLDFLMFSDHNTLKPKRENLEGWYGKVLVLIGCEINDPNDQNHYLAFRIDREIERGLKAEEYVKRVREMGGFGIIAHPAEKRSFSDAYPPYPWTAWDVDEFDGIEIWNQLSEWIEGVTKRYFPWRILHPLRSIRFPVWETLNRWDRLNKIRRIVGVGGIDVHAYKFKLFGLLPLEIYPYKVQFRSIRSHFLTQKKLRDGDDLLTFKEAEAEIFKAMSLGRGFISNFSIGNGRGFQFWVEREGKRFSVGSRIPRGGESVFYVISPLNGDMRLIRNGNEILRAEGRELIYRTEKGGVFRVEIFRKKRGWIYSNPIVIME